MKAKAATILIVDDERNIHYSFEKLLSPNYNLLSAHSAAEGIKILQSKQPDVIVMDIQMPGMSGLDALKKMQEIDARVPVVMMTAFGTMATAIKAMKYGAYEYLLKPPDVNRLRKIIEKAYQTSDRMRRQVHVAPGAPNEKDGSGDVIIGASEAMQEVYKLIGQVAAQDVTVLIRGESGTGKELVARAIYQHSKRSKKPFLEVNCAALPENLLESELFGYEKGAFTGAMQRHIGKFEQVHNGTLFLDEIGEMSLPTQAKILRVIQQGEFSRVGGNETIRSDVRLLCATNRNLEEAIKTGQFREDLYYRLNVITIQLPKLQERKEDIPVLVSYFINRYSRESGKNIEGIDATVLKTLQESPWPGNVRQLENCIRRAVVLAKGTTIVSDDLELENALGEISQSTNQEDEDALDKILDNILNGKSNINLWSVTEKKLITKALEKTGGNQVRAAKLLGIHRNTLRNRIEKYGLGGRFTQN